MSASRAPWTSALWLVTLALGVGCSSTRSAETPPVASGPDFADELAAAIKAEAAGSETAGPWLDLLDEAVSTGGAPGSLEAGLAALDALVFGAQPSLDELGPVAIAYRGRELMPQIAGRLRRAWERAGRGSALLRGAIAAAEHQLALYVGDEQAAAVWAERRGCAQEATVIGPTDWAPLSAIEGSGPVRHDAPLAGVYGGVAPFSRTVTPLVVRADACKLDVNAPTPLAGVREVVVDVSVPEAQTIWLSLTSTSAATLHAGGSLAITRGFEAGGGSVTRMASVSAPEGRLRLVARVAQKGDGNQIEIAAWDDDGLPLERRAPRPGDAPTATVRRTAGAVRAIELGQSRAGRPEDLSLRSAALLAVGEARAAEHAIEAATAWRAVETAKQKATASAPPSASHPAVDLLYVRAVELAEDLPPTKAVPRLRAAVDRVLVAWPGAWEARIARARLTERSRGHGDGVVAALDEIRGADRPDRMETAFAAALAYRAQMIDHAEAGFSKLEAQAPGSALLAALDLRLRSRRGPEAVRAACEGGTSRADSACLAAKVAVGNHDQVLAEIARLRKLRTAPDALRDVEVQHRVSRGDLAGAMSIYEAMPPGQRSMLAALGLAAGRGQTSVVREGLGRDQLRAIDAPNAIGTLVRAAGLEPDPAVALEAEGARLVADDRAKPLLAGAATAVLRHVERYSIEKTGLLRYVSYDLRRVQGTSDVAGGAPSFGPMIEGRGVPRLLRRRIHKRDGRVLEPDSAANASQGNSDLSQLEQGDYIEQVLVGWALPSDTGQLVIDTPDLMPERTSVQQAEIELSRDESVPLSIWSHPLLGKPETRKQGSKVVETWRLKDAPPRRIEDGIPRLERGVGLSLGTQTWQNVARAMGENVRSMTDRDPAVRRWAEEAAGGDRTPSLALIERVVAAAGKTVKIPNGGDLSDVAALYGGGSQRSTARTTIETGQGSRSWLVFRALRELGIQSDIAVAEVEPFSTSPSFPPHAGRFRHPLVLARIGAEEVWIDADVEGPPLPPGRISPELRGRSALLPSGRMVAVAAEAADMRDEVDVRLDVDEKGDATGTLTVLLRGRPAQGLADAFATVVGTDRLELLRGVVLGWLPGADVEDVTLSSKEGSWEIALRAKVRISGFGRPEGKDGKVWALPGVEPVHFVFPRGWVSTLGATYASRGARQSALSIDAPLFYHVRRRIQLPASAKIVRQPESVSVDDARIKATRKITASGAVIEEDFTLSLPTGTVPAEAYPSFVERVNAIDAGFLASTRVARGSVPEAPKKKAK